MVSSHVFASVAALRSRSTMVQQPTADGSCRPLGSPLRPALSTGAFLRARFPPLHLMDPDPATRSRGSRSSIAIVVVGIWVCFTCIGSCLYVGYSHAPLMTTKLSIGPGTTCIQPSLQ